MWAENPSEIPFVRSSSEGSECFFFYRIGFALVFVPKRYGLFRKMYCLREFFSSRNYSFWRSNFNDDVFSRNAPESFHSIKKKIEGKTSADFENAAAALGSTQWMHRLFRCVILSNSSDHKFELEMKQNTKLLRKWTTGNA